jgi:hypothetical protein
MLISSARAGASAGVAARNGGSTIGILGNPES